MASTPTLQIVKYSVRLDSSYSPLLFSPICVDVLQKRPTTPTLKVHTISYLKDHTKSFEYTLSVLKVLEAKTRAEIARLGGNAGLDRIVDLLHVDETNFAQP